MAVSDDRGDTCIVDLTDDDGPPNWGLAKITAVLVKDEFDLHWFGTYSKAESLAKRAYVPAYIDSRDDLEIYMGPLPEQGPKGPGPRARRSLGLDVSVLCQD